MRPCLPLLVLCLAVVGRTAAAPPALLVQVAEQWLGEKDRWAFTQVTRESSRRGVVQERRERFDPSQPDEQRWRLITIDGRPPSAKESEAFNARKNKPRRKVTRTPLEYVDLDHARIVEETAAMATYAVPLRAVAAGLFPADQIVVTLTVNKQTHALEQVKAGIEAPLNIAFGIARVLDLDFDLQVRSPPGTGKATGPATAQPNGLARAVVTKFGQRVEYAWSEFHRVPPHPATSAAP